MKIFTTACLIGSVLLCFIYMWLLALAGNHHLSRGQKLLTLQKMEVTLLLIVVSVVGATVGSILIVREARKMYRAESLENMRGLIEESARNSEKKADG